MTYNLGVAEDVEEVTLRDLTWHVPQPQPTCRLKFSNGYGVYISKGSPFVYHVNIYGGRPGWLGETCFAQNDAELEQILREIEAR
jgi:hypothetical protein